MATENEIQFQEMIKEKIIAIGQSDMPDDQKDVLRLLYDKWYHKRGKITQREIADTLPKLGSHKEHEHRTEESTLRMVRQIIRNLRVYQSAPILADRNGYWIPHSEIEVADYLEKTEREVKARIASSYETYKAMKESVGITNPFFDNELPVAEEHKVEKVETKMCEHGLPTYVQCPKCASYPQ